jgi:hypothetical protein
VDDHVNSVIVSPSELGNCMIADILVSADVAHRGWTAAQMHVLDARPCFVPLPVVGRWWLPAWLPLSLDLLG